MVTGTDVGVDSGSGSGRDSIFAWGWNGTLGYLSACLWLPRHADYTRDTGIEVDGTVAQPSDGTVGAEG